MLAEDKAAFDLAIRHHDRAVSEKGLTIWVGAEPTFTDRFSEAPEWLYQADGGDKAACALGLLSKLCRDVAQPLILRTLGRQYPGEDLARWNFGIYQRRDGSPAWSGPPDPALRGSSAPQASTETFLSRLAESFSERGWQNIAFQCPEYPHWRIAFRLDGLPPPADPQRDEHLTRPSIHAEAIPEEGVFDPLAAQGIYVVGVDHEPGVSSEVSDCAVIVRVELPEFSNVGEFLDCIAIIGQAATEAGLTGLILAGYPPPIDHTVAWTTVTPDPAVVEVNMAPAQNLGEFLDNVRSIYRSADDQGLSSYRFYYNGDVTDSGGGGQITFGGPSPAASPFFLYPQLLPNTIRYFNRHPALSYFFTPTCVGSSSQSPRPDERFRESFEELKLALHLMAQKDNCEPATLWASLAPFLTDTSGNTHRSEINVEKLWNPNLRGRGCLGLVEFRAFRMAPSAEALAARAALFRAIVALLALKEDCDGLIDWGTELHERFALPFYLKQDLLGVLDDLKRAGLGPDDAIVRLLLNDSDRILGQADIDGWRLSIQRALEFWPLAGDSASQDRGASRLIDSSTSRVQLTLRPLFGNPADLREWRVSAGNWHVPVRFEQDAEGPLMIFGLRYRTFTPWRGLHPTLGVQTPVELILRRDRTEQAYRVVIHEWKPEGGGYDGLPADWEESKRRRNQRIVVEPAESRSTVPLRDPPPLAVSPYGLDLRACASIHAEQST